jgi:glycosyl transferase family 87
VIARAESFSRSAEPIRTRLVAALAVGLFFVSWGALHRGFYTREQIVDTPVYRSYGDSIADGRIPYRDFRVEYPPGALPLFALPALGNEGDEKGFKHTFEGLMFAAGGLAVLFALLTLGGLSAGAGRTWAALGFIALAPLALGSVVLSRFDLWPAALAVAGLAALVRGRVRLGSAALGLGFATKLFPGLLLPLALSHVWRRRGRREALVCAGVFAAVAAAIVLPFLALSPGGVWNSIVRQSTRPLQIESLGSAFLLAAHQLWGAGIEMRSSSGSQNLIGGGTGAIAAVQTVLQIGAVLGAWVAYARGPADRERLVRWSAAAVCAFVVLGKVLSPQFMIWLIPLVPLVRGRRGLTASALLAAALVLTQNWFPFRYWDLALRFDAAASWLVLARDLALVALLAVLVWPTRRACPGQRTRGGGAGEPGGSPAAKG